MSVVHVQSAVSVVVVGDDRHEGRGERPARQPRRYEHRNEEQAPKDFNDSLDHNNDVE